ncbi:hypothetical protein [Ancylobacter mangrovi]|uniref:hypothetical protein n=1 Tax=Ancylobacter mangrovi TaxID=2972472 RepID=UPI00216221C1|nr:hypothetical protein [Ancylobacter mangrovi]MCS0505136.1 hypothetical protein [Ancylobacter mangrovi]
MTSTPKLIRDLFHTPDRFLRSAQLERDFYDPKALAGYIITPATAQHFQRIAECLKPRSGLRAWRVTGDYGVGKSSFALALAHLLTDPQSGPTERIAQEVGWPETPRLWPVLVTGSREPLVASVARGIVKSLERRVGRKSKELLTLCARANELAQSGGSGLDIEALVEDVRAAAKRDGAGLLLIIDEFGKLLEFAAQNPQAEDVFVFQRIAEQAMASADRPFLFLNLLHQGFQAYAETLPHATRQEWDKVGGRFGDITFDQPLAHTAALVAGALGVQPSRVDEKVANAARSAVKATATMGWLAGGATAVLGLDAVPLYPMHPTLLPALVRFFARYGQHERSLFGFLLSDEPFALKAFADRPISAEAWYGLPEFYDYIRSAFGHRLSGRSYETHWLRISATVDIAEDLSDAERRVLKAVAVLNLLDAEDLLPTDRALAACLAPQAEKETGAALEVLVDRGLLHRRGGQAGYRLWPNTSVNLKAALETAVRETPSLTAVTSHLIPYLDQSPLLARGHYIRWGTMRWFEVRYIAAGDLESALDKPTAADGVVVVALSDTDDERVKALDALKAGLFKDRNDIVVGLGQPLGDLGPELVDILHWQWVRDHVPELAHDAYAASEVARQLSIARRVLTTKLAARSGLRSRSGAMGWFVGGEPMAFERGLLRGLSDLCDNRFVDAPRIANELLNRNSLSSAAAAARQRLVEGIFEAADKEALGLDSNKAPPERSMYLSVMFEGGLHVKTETGWTLAEPTADPLHLRPALAALRAAIANGSGDPVPAMDILACLRAGRIGARDGVTPLLLALVLKLGAHEYAIYEDGTFIPTFGPDDFMRMLKQPRDFAIQHCRVAGVRADVFARLVVAFSRSVDARPAELLDVVVPLCEFAAELPDYVRRAGALTPMAAAVRDTLVKAREPATLIFRDLPVACGLREFPVDRPAEGDEARKFVNELRLAIEELRVAYQRLIGRLSTRIATALGQAEGHLDRGVIAQRAARVSLAAKEPRLRAFALRLRDPQLSDELWIESLAAYVVSRPPQKWGPGDEARFVEEVGTLAEIFYRVEHAAFANSKTRPDVDAFRLSLTPADGTERVHVLHRSPLSDELEERVKMIDTLLGKDEALRLQLAAEVLWRVMPKKKDGQADDVGDQSSGGAT